MGRPLLSNLPYIMPGPTEKSIYLPTWIVGVIYRAAKMIVLKGNGVLIDVMMALVLCLVLQSQGKR